MVRLYYKVRNWRTTLLAVLLIGAVLVLYRQFDEPVRRYFKGIKPGVHYLEQPVEGLFRVEVARIVAQSAAIEGRHPVDAIVDDVNKSIIPELNGIEIDQEATVELLFNAPRHSRITPVYRELLPELRWEHYPSLPAYQGNPRKPAVALMINVAWGEEHIPSLLEVLEQEGARGTFFLAGCWAEKNKDTIRRIHEAGHELGNHGYSDAEVFTELGGWAMARSVRLTSEIIFEATGCYPEYFTPHKGEFNDLTLEFVSRQGMRTVLWSLDTVDWQEPGAAAMREKIITHLAPGQIILMHPTADTVGFLAETLPLIAERGIKTVTVAELLSPSWLPGGEAAPR